MAKKAMLMDGNGKPECLGDLPIGAMFLMMGDDYRGKEVLGWNGSPFSWHIQTDKGPLKADGREYDKQEYPELHLSILGENLPRVSSAVPFSYWFRVKLALRFLFGAD